MKRYPIKQRPRVVSSVQKIMVSDTIPDVVLRPAQRNHDKVRSRIVDGITSTTGLFDDSFGDVPDVFNPDLDKFDLANRLLADGLTKKANQVAASGPDSVTE